MNLLESLPTVIGTAAVAPALLILWLVIAAGERPGPPAKVWTAFLLGAASISLLGVVRAPFVAILATPDNPWVAQALHSVFGVALPEETVKILVIAAVSTRRRPFADPMDPVVYGAAAGLGFAAYENLAYLVQHAEMWQSLAALRSVLTVPFHGALGVIAGAYLAIARSGTALGAHRHHRDWARITSRILMLLGPLALHAGFRFPAADAAEEPRPRSIHPIDAGIDQRPDRLQLDRIRGAAGAAGAAAITRPAPKSPASGSASCAGCGRAGARRRRRIYRSRLRADVDPPLAGQSRAQHGARAGSDRPYLDPDRQRPTWS